MHKYMSKFFLSLLLILVFALPARAGVQEGVTYLKTAIQDDWVIMALSAAGQNPSAESLQTFSGSVATDYAKRILALVAADQNPKTFTGADLVTGLQDMAAAGQIGEAALLNDDAWGILALRSAGVPTSNSIIIGAKNYLLSHQNSDGGWSWGVGFDSDTNDTAAVIMALMEAGTSSSAPAITSAVAYLQLTQEDDGGWAYEPIWDSDAGSTSWVITALNKLGQSDSAWAKGDATPQSFLLTLQTGDGSFKWVASDSTGSASMTAFSVIALSGQSFPVKVITSKYVDLILSSSASVLQGVLGQELQYTVTVVNQGPNTARNVGVVKLAGDFNNATVSVDAGTYYADTGVWLLDSLGVNETRQAVVTITLPQLDKFNWQIAVSSDETEQDANNNIIPMSVTVVEPVPVKVIPPPASGGGGGSFIPRHVDLVLSSSASVLQGVLGQELQYTVTVINQGPNTARNVGVVKLAGDFNNATISVDAGIYYADNSVWRITTLAVNETQQAVVTITLPQLDNFNWNIAVSSDETEQDVSNNTTPMSVTVVEPGVEIAPLDSLTGVGQVLGEFTVSCDLPDSAGSPNALFIGYVLKPTEGGEVWYYDPVSLKRYCLSDAKIAFRALEVFGLGITNEDLAKIPVAGEEVKLENKKIVDRLKGRILLQVESLGEAWYVDPTTGQRHYLQNGVEALNILTSLARITPAKQIFPISVGELLSK